MTEENCHPIVAGPALSYGQAPDSHERWFLVDPEANWLNARQAPALETLDVSARFGYLVIRAPGMLRLDIPLDVIEDDESVERRIPLGRQSVRVVDEGDLAAAWFTEWLGRPCRLVKIHPEADAVDWPS